jgi:hypothetical protein
MNDHVSEPFRTILNNAQGVRPTTDLTEVDPHEAKVLDRIIADAQASACRCGGSGQIERTGYRNAEFEESFMAPCPDCTDSVSP